MCMEELRVAETNTYLKTLSLSSALGRGSTFVHWCWELCCYPPVLERERGLEGKDQGHCETGSIRTFRKAPCAFICMCTLLYTYRIMLMERGSASHTVHS